MDKRTLQAVRKILVPVDFSSFGDTALALAEKFPDAEAAELHLVHVIPPGNLAFDSAQAINDRNRRATSQLHQYLTPQAELSRTIHRKVCEGLPHVEICKYAVEHDIDLIVMGTRGRGGFTHMILGSVAERVLRQAPCPVLVMRPAVNASDTISETVSEESSSLPSQKRLTEVSPAIDLIQRAVALRATDIHVDPLTEGNYGVRFRIDGRLEEYCDLDQDIAEHLTHQFRNLANLDIADPFHPQEGRLRLPPMLTELEVRVTVVPVAGGLAVALRIFDRDHVLRPLSQLGFNETASELVHRMLRREEGLILVTGPTGSGKTTTVYSMLQTLRDRRQNIVSVEDPVEYSAPFIRQMAVDPRHGVSLTSGLRTMLRMDPDVVFLGEIRDPEAADIAMRASGSGKYVFSTLHTRDVAATVTTLRDLGLENNSLAGNLHAIINQRLVRRVCPACREWQPLSDEVSDQFRALELSPPERVATPQGCDECRETGYRGRVGVFELVVVEDTLREAIAQGVSQQELRQILRTNGVKSLEYDVLTKVADGITSYKEAQQMRWL